MATCDKHGAFEQKQMLVFGKTMKTNCPACSAERKAEHDDRERIQKSYVKNEKIKRLLGESGIPKRFQQRSFENYRADSNQQKAALAVASHFSSNFDKCLETGASLLFCGKPGTGKTHLAAAIANGVCQQGRAVAFMSVLKATRIIKDTWKKDAEETEAKAYRGLIAPDLLILDEVGVQFGSDAEKMILFEILNGRYENVKPTIVISNLSPSEIVDFLGERVVDRLQEGGGSTVSFNWDSYRSQVLCDEYLPRFKADPVNWAATAH